MDSSHDSTAGRRRPNSSKENTKPQAPAHEHSAWRREAFRVVRLSIPLSAGQVLGFSQTIIVQAFMGRLGAPTLSAWVLAHTFLNVTGLSLLIGTVSAMETFCGQAAGAQRHRVLGLMLQRGGVAAAAVALPCILVWTQAARILRALGQDAIISEMAGRYVIMWAPTLLVHGGVEACQRYLVSQSVVLPSVAVAGISALTMGPANWLFISYAGWGLAGAAASYFVASVASLLVSVAFIIRLERSQPVHAQRWHGWSWDAFRGLRNYFRVAVPSTAMLCLDWWSYEAVILLAGLLPDPAVSLGAMGIAFNTHAWIFMLGNGMAAAASTRVSNALGANQPDDAKLSAEVVSGLGGGLNILAATLLIVFRRPWSMLFTSDPLIVERLGPVIVWLGLSLIGDGVSTVLSGVLRGAGRQRLGAGIMAAVAWGIGLPLQTALAFAVGWGIAGMWLGAAVSSTIQAIVEAVCVARFDWDREAQRAAQLLRETHQESLVDTAADLELDAAADAAAPLMPVV